jgi:hypothetical protein
MPFKAGRGDVPEEVEHQQRFLLGREVDVASEAG